MYDVRNAQILVNTPIKVKVVSGSNRAIILVVSQDQTIESLVKLNNEVTEQVLPPLKYGYSIIIFGKGTISLS